MSTLASLLSRDERLQMLRERITRRINRTATIQVRHSSEIALLHSLSADELKEFATSCKALVVSRVGGDIIEFSRAACS